jgi:hypothetical protein
MTAADQHACAEVILAWGLYRDQGRWPDLLATFHPDGEIAVSWFRGRFPDFVARCRQSFDAGNRSKHLLWPPVVRVNGERAVAETNVGIVVRQDIEGVRCELNSSARFLDRLERRAGAWKIRERVTIYERDRLDPVVPSEAFDRLMQNAKLDIYPEAYRYMAFRLAAAGRSLALPLFEDGTPETRALLGQFAAWLDGAS